MQDLQACAKARRFQVELAQATALAQLIADEQCFAIEAAADRLELGIHLERVQLGQLLPTHADLVSQRIHQWMNAQGRRTHGGFPGDRLPILTAE